MRSSHIYLMESPEEAIRLEIKTDPGEIRKQARWCGIKPGMRVLDPGCGPGKTSSILHTMIQPGGELVGLDFSEERIGYAKAAYGDRADIQFHVHNLTNPLDHLGSFDLVWVRFLLEYFRMEGYDIVTNLTRCLKPGGILCLIDLDYNCLSHYELPSTLEGVLFQIIKVLEEEYDFDAYAGRKLYAYLYDLGYKDIEVDLKAHHLIYGELQRVDAFNWYKKAEIVSTKAPEIFEKYPGGKEGFLEDLTQFLEHPRRFTYTPLILCKGVKPT